MSKRASQKSKPHEKCKIRFTRPVKSDGRWYEAGEEALFHAELIREFLKKGLAEKLVDSKCKKRGSDAVSDG
jgi:hypothetical protein